MTKEPDYQQADKKDRAREYKIIDAILNDLPDNEIALKFNNIEKVRTVHDLSEIVNKFACNEKIFQAILLDFLDSHIMQICPIKNYTNDFDMTFVYILPGTFFMGSPENETGRSIDEIQHLVELTQGFYLQTTEVTQGQWKSVMGNIPSYFKTCGEDCPVENVTWGDAQRFIRELNLYENSNRYRLPTEAQWEYAARAASTTAFANGDIIETACNIDTNLSKMAWYCGNSNSKTHPVAQKQPNAWGLFDMHGNVWEWCSDWYGKYFAKSVTDPVGPSSGSFRVLRGGGWGYDARSCRSANRHYNSHGSRYYSIGLRLMRTP